MVLCFHKSVFNNYVKLNSHGLRKQVMGTSNPAKAQAPTPKNQRPRHRHRHCCAGLVKRAGKALPKHSALKTHMKLSARLCCYSPHRSVCACASALRQPRRCTLRQTPQAGIFLAAQHHGHLDVTIQMLLFCMRNRASPMAQLRMCPALSARPAIWKRQEQCSGTS